jgi:hypothetical protein
MNGTLDRLDLAGLDQSHDIRAAKTRRIAPSPRAKLVNQCAIQNSADQLVRANLVRDDRSHRVQAADPAN